MHTEYVPRTIALMPVYIHTDEVPRKYELAGIPRTASTACRFALLAFIRRAQWAAYSSTDLLRNRMWREEVRGVEGGREGGGREGRGGQGRAGQRYVVR